VAEPTLEDYRWLVSEPAERYLAEAAADDISLARQTKRLRKDLSSPRTHLILEQRELRQRAQLKFSGHRCFGQFATERGTHINTIIRA
jgi:hypothetical protein